MGSKSYEEIPHLVAVHAPPGDAPHAVAACIVGDKVADHRALTPLLGEGGLRGPGGLVQNVATAGAHPAEVAPQRRSGSVRESGSGRGKA